jgi:predicted PurR-regulated permease PerM
MKSRPDIDVVAKPNPYRVMRGSSLLAACLVIAIAYLARQILMPIAVAFLLAFLLAPLANRLETMHLGRKASAIIAVLVGLFAVGSITWCLVIQFGKFGNELPKYQENIHVKLRQLGMVDGGHISRLENSLKEFQKDLTPTNSPTGTNSSQLKTESPPEQKAVPVVIRSPNSSPLDLIRNWMGSFLNVLTTAFLVTVFCIFMLLGRDDLRDRLLRIVGSRNAKLTNHVLSDTAHRLSRYLLMQLVINLAYGVPIGFGLWCIGIPNPLLWGIMASLFRYIPYAGPWIAASLPFAVAFAVSSDWIEPALVLVVFAIVEIVTANFVEPFAYGNSVGITPLAVLLAAVFWTWLWGPTGLLLSMPLTVCLISLAKHVPQLELLDQLFAETKTKAR